MTASKTNAANANRSGESGTMSHSHAHETPDVLTEHDGNLAAARRRFPSAPLPWIDLSTGINQAPYPVGSLTSELWERLPEGDAIEKLEAQAAVTYGTKQPNLVVAAPGTQALIQILPRVMSAKTVGILDFTYAEHRKCWENAGATVKTVTDPHELSLFDVGIIVNPNNPDGRIVDVDTLLSISNKLASKNGHLIVDEAFIDVLDQALSLVPHVEHCRAIILRSFGKTYGLAGLRLGFAIAPREITSRIRADLGPWAISGPAIEIGLRALADADWLAETSVRLQSDVKRLDQLLRTLGLDPVGGSALFRLAKSADATSAFNALAEIGILVRAFRDKPNWLRFGMPGTEAGWNLLEERTRGLKLA